MHVIKFFENIGPTKQELEKYFESNINKRSLLALMDGIYTIGPNIPFVYPQTCSFELTNRCNLRCKHCYIGEPPKTKELSTNNVLKIIGNIADAGFLAVPISGGEALLRDDITPILKEVKNYNMDVILSTNGTLLTKNKINELKSYLDIVCISLDSHNETIHDSFRGVKDAHKLALMGVKNCIDNDIPVRIFTTLTKFNYDKLPEFINFLEENKIEHVVFFDLNLVGYEFKTGLRNPSLLLMN